METLSDLRISRERPTTETAECIDCGRSFHRNYFVSKVYCRDCGRKNGVRYVAPLEYEELEDGTRISNYASRRLRRLAWQQTPDRAIDISVGLFQALSLIATLITALFLGLIISDDSRLEKYSNTLGISESMLLISTMLVMLL